jgi:predicted LPLAT superfamily acyltransferase
VSREWLAITERAGPGAVRVLVWIALHLGRRVARALLIPTVAYFVLSGGRARAASRDYLRRVLARKPSLRDIYRHFYSFAEVALDRVYFLSDRWSNFDIRLHGEKALLERIEQHGGCVLLGAHLGSFECLRTLGRRRSLGINMVMFEQNTPAVAAMVRAINPAFEKDVISLGAPASMLQVIEQLEAGNLIGMLADRALSDHGLIQVRFLGGVASFPTAPFRISAVAGRPVILMVGLYRGRNRYDVYFETLVDSPELSTGRRDEIIERWIRLYADRLAYYCGQAPFNWFNFFSFWAKESDSDKN